MFWIITKVLLGCYCMQVFWLWRCYRYF